MPVDTQTAAECNKQNPDKLQESKPETSASSGYWQIFDIVCISLQTVNDKTDRTAHVPTVDSKVWIKEPSAVLHKDL